MENCGGSFLGSFLLKLDIFGHPIGVQYRGDTTYRTRLGAFCTLFAYVLIIFNAKTLISAYLDHSKQEERTQIKFVDSYQTEPFGLKDHAFDIVFVISPPMPERVGRLKVKHDFEGEAQTVHHKICSEELMEKLDEYWIPRPMLR